MGPDESTPVVRREFLALAGSVTLAGCSNLPIIGSDDQRPTLNGTALSTIASGPMVSIAEPMPAPIEQAYIDEKVARVRSLLNSLPDTLGPDEIPNGAVRKQLVDRRTNAEGRLQKAMRTSTNLSRLEKLRDARREAAYVAATWSAINDDLTYATVLKRTRQVRSQVTNFRNQRRYIGNDPITAVLVQTAVDEALDSAQQSLQGQATTESHLPAFVIGEVASTNESARAAIDDGQHLYRQFTNSLSTQRFLRTRFKQTVAAIINHIDAQRGELPTVENPYELVERDVTNTPAGDMLDHLYNGISYESSYPSLSNTTWLAQRILDGQTQLAQLRALQTVRNRIANGEMFTAESADAVRRFRSQALSAIRNVRNSGRYPKLRQYMLAYLVGRIEDANEGFRELSGPTTPSTHAIAAYVRVMFVARAVPRATQRVGQLLME